MVGVRVIVRVVVIVEGSRVRVGSGDWVIVEIELEVGIRVFLLSVGLALEL